jgi:hypothetical protein
MQIYKANEKLDGFKLLMNWNQEELEQWALAQRQKEEDNQALEKYRHQDAAKVKELQLALEKMSRAVLNKKGDLEAEVSESERVRGWTMYVERLDFLTTARSCTPVQWNWEGQGNARGSGGNAGCSCPRTTCHMVFMFCCIAHASFLRM